MQTRPSTTRVLAIEDCEGDWFLLRSLLKGHSEFQLQWANRLADGQHLITKGDIDVVLLDISLPDGNGLESLSEIQSTSPSLPVIVLTGMSDQFALQSLQNGAQDYLTKGEMTSQLLVRSLRYAIERKRLLRELQATRQRELGERDTASLRRATSSTRSPVTAAMFGQITLQHREPNLFERSVDCYEELIDTAIKKRAFKVEDDVSGRLRSLAEEIGSVGAAPRDILDIHLQALNRKTKDAKPARVQVCNDEGRYLMLELVGHLCSYYRRYCTHAFDSLRSKVSILQSDDDQRREASA